MKNTPKKDKYIAQKAIFRKNLYQVISAPDDEPYTETYEELGDIALNEQPKLVAIYKLSHFEEVSKPSQLKRTKV